jgi:predicted nicotinamide N-methyase
MTEETNKPRNHLIVDASAEFVFKYRQYGNVKTIVVQQTPDETTWPGGALWDIGILLAKLMVMVNSVPQPSTKVSNNKEDIMNVPRARLPDMWPISWKDCTILELGCGVGLTGLVGAALGAKLTILTDLDVVIEKVTKKNIELNKNRFSKSQKVVASTLCWGNKDDELACRRLLDEAKSKSSGTVGRKKKMRNKQQNDQNNYLSSSPIIPETSDPSIILIGDVAYQHKPGAPSHFDILVSTLLQFATTKKTLVLFGTRMRMPASADLLDMIKEHFDELIAPIDADEIDSTFAKSNLGRKSLITLHFFKRKV